MQPEMANLSDSHTHLRVVGHHDTAKVGTALIIRDSHSRRKGAVMQ